MTAATALSLTGVRKSFGKVEIIRGVNLSVRQGERHALIGPNGAGKSTLFNLISGRTPLSSGAVLLNGENITNLEPHIINRRGLSRSFQISNIFPKLTVLENLICAVLYTLGYRYSFWHRVVKLGAVRERAQEVLELIGLASRASSVAGTLSYAEQRALEIGLTICGQANVILLDEPTAGMSRSESNLTMALIRRVTVGKTLLMVEHDMSVVFALADRISVLVYGQVIATGDPSQIRANSAVQEAYLGTLATELQDA